ncbi:LLM class flavin-dependent oxidoreductase [Celeribacter indicus]|uniref:Oxidoreductase n=1 Tax=Celeribacter indicus TaxID=1208324 RepID=A0A0B5E3X8_9RHOB|nr:LLM class flavin-dependent oxidoreductase [Celeribacter indicus]AJE47087.1 oxidoreductase [Celeribacter indicus]SDW91262.1 probable oxidoreductase, LLM family [Celeribacter indicus]
MEIGLFTFGDVGTNPHTGYSVTADQRLRNAVEEIVLADQVGIDVYGLGEHHRADYAVSAVAVALAGAAAQTKRIRLTSAVSVLSSDDPVRVFQQFATLDGLSAGRAEIIAGRGAFVESFPLFGYDLGDYDDLFVEKLHMLLEINRQDPPRWPGSPHTRPLDGLGVYPRPFQERLPVWMAVGGTPQSAARAASLGLPAAFALILGGEWARIAPLLQLYHQTGHGAGHDSARLKTSLNVHGFVHDSMEKALDIYYPAHSAWFAHLGRDRGMPTQSREQFRALSGPRGGYFVGGPSEVAEKILAAHEVLRFDRILIEMGLGIIDHRQQLEAIEILGTRVIPEVRRGLSKRG